MYIFQKRNKNEAVNLTVKLLSPDVQPLFDVPNSVRHLPYSKGGTKGTIEMLAFQNGTLAGAVFCNPVIFRFNTDAAPAEEMWIGVTPSPPAPLRAKKEKLECH